MTQSTTGDDTELEYQKRLYAEAFRVAFYEGIASLSAGQRQILKYTYADGLPPSRLAALYLVDRAQVARWIASARAELTAHMRRIFGRKLGIDDWSAAQGPAETIARFIERRLDASLTTAQFDA